MRAPQAPQRHADDWEVLEWTHANYVACLKAHPTARETGSLEYLILLAQDLTLHLHGKLHPGYAEIQGTPLDMKRRILSVAAVVAGFGRDDVDRLMSAFDHVAHRQRRRTRTPAVQQ